MKVAY